MAYLDAGTTQRLNAAGRIALLQALDDGWADPSRLHREGRRAQLMIDEAAASIAQVLDVRVDELHLLRSGTEAAHRAVEGLVHARRRDAHHVVVGAVEHSSVLDAARASSDDYPGDAAATSPVVVPVDRDGLLDLAALEEGLARQPIALAAVQSVNQETGTAQRLDDVAQICRSAGVPLVVDAAQSVGREQLPEQWDVLTASAHKWGGPAGVGVMAVRTGVRWRPPSPLHALDRASLGFPDVPAVVAAAAALQQAESERATVRPRLMRLTDRIRVVAAAIPDVEVVGHAHQRAAHLVTFSCLYVAGEAIVDALDRLDLSVASGSACAADANGPSHVLAAMGVLTHGNVRIGLAPDVDDAEVDRLLEVLPGVIATIRTDAGVDRL